MTACLRHASCRTSLRKKIAAWPTATYPRTFAVVTLGAIGHLIALMYVLAAIPLVIWLMTL